MDETAVSGPQPSALAAFIVAEARVSLEGVNPRTLAAMHGAVKVRQLRDSLAAGASRCRSCSGTEATGKARQARGPATS